MIFRKAILIVHGFVGGTYDQEELANYLELNRNFDVYQFTLPGHSKNLSKVKGEEWISRSEEMVNWLISHGYHKIYLIGHSMGGVIATYLATKHKEIKKLVLAAPAFNYLEADHDRLHVYDSLKDIPKIIKSYGGDEVFSRLLKLDASGLKEFTHLVQKYYDYPSEVTCPVLILQGNNDTLVPKKSSEYVYDSVKSKYKRILYFDNTTHDIFRGKNKEEKFKVVEKFLKGRKI